MANNQLSRSEVIKVTTNLATLAMNLSYFRDPNTLKLTGWVNQEVRQLSPFVSRKDVDAYLPQLAKRLIQDYDYLMQTLQQIGKDPSQVATLTWMKPFIVKWRQLPLNETLKRSELKQMIRELLADEGYSLGFSHGNVGDNPEDTGASERDPLNDPELTDKMGLNEEK